MRKSKKLKYDLHNQRFGRWTVSALSSKKYRGANQWLCKCDCGNEGLVLTYSLRSGHSKSCGCLAIEGEDLTGQRFGKLLITSQAPDFVSRTGKTRTRSFNYLCDCGKKGTATVGRLNAGRSKSCGCAQENPESGFLHVFRQYRAGAKQRNLPFDLSKQEAKRLMVKNCFYCGGVPTTRNATGLFAWNGIDRVHNDRGYSMENCVPCCAICNRAKMGRHPAEFLVWIKRVYNNLFNLMQDAPNELHRY